MCLAGLINILSKPLDEIESEWLAYINSNYKEVQSDPQTAEPSISFMSPPDHAMDVNPNIKEIVVQFNVPMEGDICVTADCKDICYRDAYWKDVRTLAIRLPNNLQSNREYFLELGNDTHKCFLKSKFGKILPIKGWRFTTGPAR